MPDQSLPSPDCGVGELLETSVGAARAVISLPSDPRAVLVLGPGASGSIAAPDLHAARAAALELGVAVALVEPPYRVAGRRLPPRGAQPDQAFTEVCAVLQQRVNVPLISGGRSFGSRVACRTAEATGAVGVVCLAFPLHPPGRPERSRVDELDAVGVPVLVVAGERDPFGRPDPAAGRQVVLVAGDHSLKKGLPAVTDAVTAWLETLLSGGV